MRQFFFAGNVPLQALSGEGGKLYFNQVQPRGRLRRVNKLEFLRQTKRFLRLKHFIKGTFLVRVQIVQNERDLFRCRVVGRQFLQMPGKFDFAPLVKNVHQALSGQRFDGRQQTGRAEFLIGIMLFGNVSASGCRNLRHDIAQQKARSLVIAQDRPQGVVGQAVEP